MIQRFCTSVSVPGYHEGAFPSDLLSNKPLATSERDIGMNYILVFHSLMHFDISKRRAYLPARGEFLSGLDD